MTNIDTAPTSEVNASSEARAPRRGWEEQYQRRAENGDDALLDGDWSLMKWDNEEWEW